MSASGIMAASSLAGGVAEFGGALGTASAQRQQGKWAQESADFNARMAELQAADALRRGENEARQAMSKGRQVVGAQRAAYAASGVDVNTGSAADVAADTEYQAEKDAQTIRANAWKASWGLTSEAEDQRQRGRMAALAGEATANQTFLTGGLSLVRGAAGAAAAWNGRDKPQTGQKLKDYGAGMNLPMRSSIAYR